MTSHHCFMSWHPLCLWRHIHYIWCHTHCVCDNTRSISDLKPILSAITSTVYVTTPTLSKTSHQLCKTSQVEYVCHHVHYTWHNIQTLRQQPLVFLTSHDLNWWHHMHYTWHVTYCIWYHIHYMCDITQCLYLWYLTLYVYYIYTLYGITHSVMTTHTLWNFTDTMSDIAPTVSESSHTVDQVYQTPCMYDITATMFMTSYELHVRSHPQFRTSQHFMYDIRSISLTSLLLYLCYHIHPIDDITATICMTSHPVYLWHHIHYIYDIISTKYDTTTLCVDDATLGICMTSFALQMTTHPLYHSNPQYLWYHIHFRQDNPATVSDITPNVSMSSHHLHWHLTHFCITSHPPSVWYHMNYM